jgi:hypothetical protein
LTCIIAKQKRTNKFRIKKEERKNHGKEHIFHL